MATKASMAKADKAKKPAAKTTYKGGDKSTVGTVGKKAGKFCPTCGQAV